MRSKKELALLLSQLAEFEDPDVKLEQYPTPSEIAAEMLWLAKMEGNIEGKHVVDLGAGTGILGIGTLILGAKKVTFIETDIRAAKILENNMQLVEKHVEGEHDLVLADLHLTDIQADTILMNPPFGTRVKNADLHFLEYALVHAPYVYAFHKTSTLTFLINRVASLGSVVKETRQFSFPLRQTMAHHEKKLTYIDVSLLVITPES